ncbi:MAG: hypothetical protein IJ983_00890, partial [Kiritimatiellae bacterium]|nr:hypothetical protein [Kiritimatiellia bacterium]
LRSDGFALHAGGRGVDALACHQQQFPRFGTQRLDGLAWRKPRREQQPLGVASLRSVSTANSQQSSAQWEADTPPSLAAGYWLLAAGTLPTHQKFVLPRVSGEKEFLMRWPYRAARWG